MCFSAPVSFVTSGGLAVLGGASLRIAKREDKILALIPFFFAIQQAFEGWQWLAIKSGAPSMIAAYGFLFFAFVLWPVYVPLAVFIIDKSARKIVVWFILLGSILVLYYLISLYLYGPFGIKIINRSIDYYLLFPLAKITKVIYLFVVLTPFIITSNYFLRWFGVIIIASAIVSSVFFAATFVSTWCFFAAIISTIFFIHLAYKKSFYKV